MNDANRISDYTDKINSTRGFGLFENFLAKKRIRIANKKIPSYYKKGRILDIGCGNNPLFLLNSGFKERYGIDKFIGRSINNGIDQDNIKLIQCNIEDNNHLPFENEYFDTVTMLAVFEHIDPRNLIDILGEIHRVFKKGGMFFLTTPSSWTDKLLRAMAGLKLVSSTEIEEHKDTYTPSKIISLMVKTGFNEGNIECGYFELFMNIWIKATKNQ